MDIHQFWLADIPKRNLEHLKERARINGYLYDDLTGRHIQTENRKFDDYVKNNSINPVALGLPVR